MLSEGCWEEIQKFYEEFFGIRYDLIDKFQIDCLDSFPFMDPILVFNPSGSNSQYLIKKLEGLGVTVECDPWVQSNFVDRLPISTLKVTDWSDRPSKNTLGKSPKQINVMIPNLFGERSFLSLNDYLIATGLIFASTGNFLEERFSTYFPEISTSDNVCMARADVRPLDHKLIITSGNSSVGCGARLAINIPLKE